MCSQAKTSHEPVPCPYCGAPNKIKKEMLKRIQVRCGQCKLLLSEKHHIKFHHLDASIYRHPLETQSIEIIQSLPGLSTVLAKIEHAMDEEGMLAFFQANSIQVTENQFRDLYVKLDIICKTLNLAVKPDLYVSFTGLPGELGMQAFTGGIQAPFIVISAPLLERLDEIEVFCVLAHEVGYIHCKNLPYKMAADFMHLHRQRTMKRQQFNEINQTITTPHRMNLLSWRQKAKLSADRAALLVCQDPDVMASMFMKIAGGVLSTKINVNQFREQAEAFDEKFTQNWIDKNWFLQMLSRQSFPFPVWRAAEMYRWLESRKGFEEILKVFAVG